MQSQTVIWSVPSWLLTTGVWIKHNWTTALGVILVAVFASITVEIIKRKYNTNQVENMGKKAITWLLTASTTVFTVLGSLLFYASANKGFLQTLPVIGSHVVEGLGVAYTLYNLRFNKWFETFAAWATKITKTKPATASPVVTQAPTPTQGATESAADFVVQ